MPCDVCGKPLKMADAEIVSPNEMRIIADNGYGETVAVLAAFPVEDRRTRFRTLAFSNDTDWALCRSCYQNAQPYSADSRAGGMSRSDMESLYKNSLKPMFDAAAAMPGNGADDPLEEGIGDIGALMLRFRRRIGGDQFLCPSCRNSILAAEAINRAVSPLLADVGEWEIASVVPQHFAAIAARLDAIDQRGFSDNMTRESADTFECDACDARLSLARAYASQYPKAGAGAQRAVAMSRHANAQHPSPSFSHESPPTTPKSRGAGFLVFAALFVMGLIGAAWFFFRVD